VRWGERWREGRVCVRDGEKGEVRWGERWREGWGERWREGRVCVRDGEKEGCV
jgi:hypothetical protein